jgi:Lon-like ATP-dependent protease
LSRDKLAAAPQTNTRLSPATIASIRAIHGTTSLQKDKRWVNPASEEAAERTEEGDEAKKVDGAEEAESSKAAEARAAQAKPVEQVKASSSTRSPSSSSPPAGSSAAPPSSSSSDSPKPTSSSKEIAKPAIPEVYPQVLALPITRRPLFPGFYKAVTITSPPVIKAIRDLLAHGQPYIGAFLLKDSQSDSDVITSMDQVHPVGVFAQITSVFGSPDSKGNKEEGSEPKPETLTAVLYPHRRIRIDELVTQSPTGDGVPIAQVVNEVVKDETGAEEDVPSFEKDVPSVEEVREELGTVSRPREEEKVEEGGSSSMLWRDQADHAEAPAKPLSPINFLHPLLPQISLTNVTNVEIEPYKKDSQMVRAVMGELISVFKDIAQLQPIFREQSELHGPEECQRK